MIKKNSHQEPKEVLYRIKRGLVGYVSYLAACEMNESFSEYVLYEPVLRILTARGYSVQCEVVCPGIEQPSTGDKKKLDFVANFESITFALEVKWARTNAPRLKSDLEKLAACRREKNWRSFLCIFGRKSHIENLRLTSSLKEKGKAIYAEFGATRYGCRVYELISTYNPSEVELSG